MAKRRSHTAASVLQSPRKLKFECPVCGGELDCDYKHGTLGRAEWFYGCFSCASRLSRDEFNDGLCAVGIHPWKLKSGRFDELRPLGPEVRGARERAPLPTTAHADGWHSRLMTERRPLRYLMRERGLSEATLVRYRLGWDGDAQTITLPVHDAAGKIENLRRRKLGNCEPFVGLAGRGSQLYPLSAITETRGLVVCEGELDCLVLNQFGLPAITSTAGAGHWNPEWTPLLRGRQVAVMYDVDAEAMAEKRAAEFRAAGLRAFAVHLSREGLKGKADISDALIGAGRSAAWLRQLIRRERAVEA